MSLWWIQSSCLIEQLERTQRQHGAILVTLVQDVQKLKSPPITRAIGFIARGSAKKQAAVSR